MQATDVLRVYDSIRTAHLERFTDMVPGAVLYRERRYDFDASLAPPGVALRRAGRAATVAVLLRTPFGAVELSEPLMTGRWLDNALALLAIRLSDAVRGRRTVVGAYCIGLTDPVAKLGDRRHVPEPVALPWSRLVIGLLVRSMDRLAVGTQGSYDLMARYVDREQLARRARLFPALPAPCPGAADERRQVGPRDEHRVLFLGAFSERKGIRQLLAAWEQRDDPDLTLTLIGKGPLLPAVERWVSSRTDAELLVDPPRDVIHRELRAAHVLVLPSQRRGAWREQVGLPIVEGLAHGCEIVTTDETGLAGWLAAHGHRVVPGDAGPRELASAVTAAARATRSEPDVLTDLPAEDSRLAADRWLLAPPRTSIPRPQAREVGSLLVASTRRSLHHNGVRPARLLARKDPRPVFVVGSPRSGTTFTAKALGRVPGFVDLGELRPLKALIPYLTTRPLDEAARAIRRVVAAAQRLGLNAGSRAIEQTPESTFLIAAIARAYPHARFVHLVRDGRDVAASLLALGWLEPVPVAGERVDEVGAAFGEHARFWVEPQRRAEFERAGTATRSAWVWRRYESTAREALSRCPERAIEIRYEELVTDPGAVARRLAAFLDVEDRAGEVAAALGGATTASAGRWRRDLSAAALAAIDAEAGALLRELGYAD